MIVVLLVSTGAAWETRALTLLNESRETVVLKRCVDLEDLLAAASTGQAQAAVLGADLPGIDAAVVDTLRGYAVRTVAVAEDVDLARGPAERIGIGAVVAADRLDDLVAVLKQDQRPDDTPEITLPARSASPPPVGSPLAGRVIAVWGPAGAPGRTTVAAAVAGELARRRLATLLVDADPYGGAVAQQLGVLDEVSGLLSAARLVAGGHLAERFATTQRRLSDQLRVVTGLPRPDRWVEVRPGVLTQLVAQARQETQVVIDTGFSLEQDPTLDVGARPERNGLTLEALAAADEILVVGGADPVGLARLARAVAEIHERLPDPAVRLVVNRMRPTLGWREIDVRAMLEGFGAAVGVHFLPDDQPAVDAALVAGRTLIESGESPLTRAVAGLVDAMAGVRG